MTFSKSKIEALEKTANYLKSLVINLAERLAILEQALSKPQDDNHLDGVLVTGSLELSQINRVNLSEQQLVEIYNDVPQVLIHTAIIVELTPNSFRAKLHESIFLERIKTGKYWIVPTDKDIFWLVPSVALKINIHQVKSLQSLFDCYGDTPSSETNFIIIKPARVSILPSIKQWKLEERGMIKIYNPYNESPLKLELEQMKQERNQFAVLLEQSQKDCQDLKSQLQEMFNERKTLVSQMEFIEKRLELLEKNCKN